MLQDDIQALLASGWTLHIQPLPNLVEERIAGSDTFIPTFHPGITFSISATRGASCSECEAPERWGGIYSTTESWKLPIILEVGVSDLRKTVENL